jgi:hypothetical protein
MRNPLNLRPLLSRKTALVAAGGAAVVALSATAAFAYWTTGGSGSGSAATGTAQSVTITQLGTVTGLVPGGASQPVDFTITNPASTAQYVSSVTVAVKSGWTAQADSSKPACSAADFTIVQPTAVNQDLPNGNTDVKPSGASIALKDAATNQDNCKGVSVDLAFTSS